jgi:hypothetical protein
MAMVACQKETIQFLKALLSYSRIGPCHSSLDHHHQTPFSIVSRPLLWFHRSPTLTDTVCIWLSKTSKIYQKMYWFCSIKLIWYYWGVLEEGWILEEMGCSRCSQWRGQSCWTTVDVHSERNQLSEWCDIRKHSCSHIHSIAPDQALKDLSPVPCRWRN